MTDKQRHQSPAFRCTHYLRGFCLHAESTRRSKDETLLCIHVAKLARDWDAFLDRAEAFALDEATATAIWQRIAGKTLAGAASRTGSKADCPQGLAMQNFVDCPNIAQGLCLLAMPLCEGICASFASRRDPIRELL